jgi:hypothetical protein
MSDASLPPIGTIVAIDDPRCPGLYKVTNHGPKNATLVPCTADGALRPGRGARFPGYMLHPADSNAADVLLNGATTNDLFIFDPGALVTSASRPGVFVVLADKGDKVNIARLGGDSGRYLRMPRGGVKPLALAELANHL